MICSILRCTRQPIGMNVQRPAETWRMYPPRTSSLCEAASASAGASRRVGMKSRDCLAIKARRLVQRNQGGFGHRERGRLGHLQPLRALHPVGQPAVDLVEELVDEHVGL